VVSRSSRSYSRAKITGAFGDHAAFPRYTRAHPHPGGGLDHPPPAASVTRKSARVGDGTAPKAQLLENQLLGEDRPALEAVEPVWGEVERGLETENLLGDRASDGRALHEAVT
jgi:hypothetical protein